MPQTVLIVDDEKRLVSLVESYLTQEGYRVATAFNGKQALEVAAKEKPDLIILDIMMPEMNGYEFLRCERFARQLAGRFNLPVHLTDERYSSAIAQSEGAGAGQLDAQAAAIILRQYLSEAGAPPAMGMRNMSMLPR